VHLIKARTAIPEVSPDGRWVAYIANSRSLNPELRVARLSDGKDTAFRVPLRGTRRTSAILGRARWMPDAKAVAFLAQDENGENGVFVEDFDPLRDTSATKAKLGGFDSQHATESFGISPYGTHMTVAGWEQSFGLMTISGMPLSEE
jgi:hypothetical protein